MSSIKSTPTPSKWQRLRRHELSAIFGDMSEAEFQTLVTDMETHGYHGSAVLLFAGKVLDGWHQCRGAVVSKQQPRFEMFKGTEEEAFEEAWRRNGARRHYNESQRAMLGARIANRRAGNLSGKTQNSANLQNSAEPLKQEQVAETLNVSPRSLSDARKVLAEGTPELQEGVSDGTLSVSDAAKVADQSPAKQRAAVNKVRKGKAKTLREAAGIHPGAAASRRASARLAAQSSQPTNGKVKCPTCRGSGEITEDRAARLKFTPPTVEEVTAYCKERENDIDAEQFVAHYTSNGWKVGKSPMKDWRSAVITWEKNKGEFDTTKKGKPGLEEQILETGRKFCARGKK